MNGRPRVLLNAPVVPIDFRAFDSDGLSYPIEACIDCLPWHAEVVLDVEDETQVLVREWHAVDCPFVTSFLAEED